MGKGKYTLRSIIVRCVVIMVGVFITAYGAEAFVLANLGSDPVTAYRDSARCCPSCMATLAWP